MVYLGVLSLSSFGVSGCRGFMWVQGLRGLGFWGVGPAMSQCMRVARHPEEQQRLASASGKGKIS